MNILVLQVSAFGKYKDITPTPERYMKLMEMFPGFLPVTGRAIQIDANNGSIEDSPRIQMNNQQSPWRIEIQPDRINAIFTPNNDQGIVNELIDNGLALIKKTCESLEINTNAFNKFMRLAVNIQFADPTGNEKPHMPFVGSLPKQVKEQSELQEWTVSFNRKGCIEFNGYDEATNEIMACSLGTSQDNPNQYAFLLTVDINTTQKDSRERFDMEQFEVFVTYAKDKISEMIDNFAK